MDLYQLAAKTIINSKYTIVFSGAGASAESGIPTFRDKGGLWEKYPVELFGTPDGLLHVLLTDPKKFAEFITSAVETLLRAKPNKGHLAIGELEKIGFVKAVITQNIDALHQEAGNTKVIEVHGSMTRMRCFTCHNTKNFRKDEVAEFARRFSERAKDFRGNKIADILVFFRDVIPTCDCGGFMRPDVVLFTEPVHNINIAFEEARKSDCCVVVGTSGVVYPAAYVPQIVKGKGGIIIEINPNQRSFDSDIYIDESFSHAMPRILEEVKKNIA